MMHHVKVPFDKIITRDMGTSVCPYCKSKFVGSAYFCTNRVWWYQHASSYGSWCRGDGVKGRQFKSVDLYSVPVTVTASSKRQCDTLTVWDLQSEFDKQSRFFSFLSAISYLNPDKVGLLEEYRGCLPSGLSDEYRIQLMENEIQRQNMEISRLMGAVTQIADKMSSAGQALCF